MDLSRPPAARPEIGPSPAIPEEFERSLVSVVIPVFDGAPWLRESIESARGQTYRPIEIIAVDDGSTDDSPAILAACSDVRVITQPNSGCAVARNRGIRAARGEFVAFIDQDDRWRPEKIERQVALLRERPDAGYALGHQAIFLEPGCPLPPWFELRSQLFDRPHVGLLPGTMLVRRSTFLQVGIFDERYRIGSDSDWLIRARDAAIPVAIVPEVVIDKRIHDANLSSDPGSAQELLLMLAASVRNRHDAERAAAGRPTTTRSDE